MKNYTELKIEIPGIATGELLIAQLAELGFDGFEEGDNFLLAYGKEDDIDEKLLKDLLEKYRGSFTQKILPEENWNKAWESNFEPVVIDCFAAIRADFHEPIVNVEHEIIITPKMSFGTGHHATTYMMIQQMQALDFTGKSVFDFGTGTGILSILAEKMGAAEVTAIDNDEWSINNAEENIQRNKCSKINLFQSGSIPLNKRFHIILANINKHVLLENLVGLSEKLYPRGYILLSGLLEEDSRDILLKTSSLSLKNCKTQQREKWVSILLGN